MSTGSPKKEKHELAVIEIRDYGNLEEILSKIIIPFAEVMRNSIVPDVYVIYEKTPFEKRDPLYQTIMRQEFGDAIRTFKNEVK